MTIPIYLAMTATEFANTEPLPQNLAWMACHFSCYETGIENLPENLPPDSMVIINDRIPVTYHDPQLILQQLTDLCQHCRSPYFLLDFPQPDIPLLAEIAKILAENLPRPVAVSHTYAKDLNCPIFLPPPPLHIPLREHIKPWRGRELWIEAALTAQTVTVTASGSQISKITPVPLQEPVFQDDVLHCSYHLELKEEAAIFHLNRTAKQMPAFLEEAEQLGVKLAVGLYQQLKNRESN